MTLQMDNRSGLRARFCSRPRQGLRDILTSERIGWIDDPSNNNFGYERIAMRHRLAEMTAENLAAIDQRQRETAARRQHLVSEAAPMIATYSANLMPGLVFVDLALFEEPQSAAKLLALRALMSFAAGAPSADELHANVLFEAAAKHGQKPGGKAERLGAGGVLADIRANGVYLLQERRRGSVNTKAFAGRYRLLNEAPGRERHGQFP